jgi:hypothetical protein
MQWQMLITKEEKSKTIYIKYCRQNKPPQFRSIVAPFFLVFLL